MKISPHSSLYILTHPAGVVQSIPDVIKSRSLHTDGTQVLFATVSVGMAVSAFTVTDFSPVLADVKNQKLKHDHLLFFLDQKCKKLTD